LSIVTVRKIIEKPGCYIPASIVMIVGIAGGLFVGSQGGGQVPAEAGPIVASVGSYKLSSVTLESVAADQMRQLGGAVTSLTPELEARFLADTVRQLIEQGYVLELARQKKVDLSDGKVIEAIGSGFDEQLQMERRRLEETGVLKKGASDSEFLAELKKQQPGFDPEKEKARQIDLAKQALADPNRRPQVLAYVAGQELQKALAAAYNPTEEELKSYFTSYTVKRILVNPQSAGSSTPKEVAEKARKEIVGGMAFETAMERYSGETPPPGKKIGETTLVVSGRQIVSDPQYAGIPSLKAGEVSPVVESAGNAILYKLVSSKSELPKDFADKKDEYRREYQQSASSAAFRRELEALKATTPIQWESKGYEALYLWLQEADAGLNLAGDALKKRKEKLREIADQAKAAMESDLAGRRAAILAHFAAISQIYNESNPDEKKALADQRLEAISYLLEITENPTLRLEMVDLLAAKKDPAAGEELVRVAESNFDPTAAGQVIYSGVDAKTTVLEKAKLLTPEQSKRIQAAQAAWRAAKKEHDAAEAEAKRQQAEEERLAREAEAKAKAEEAKNKPAPTPRKQGD
jgi:hypothetical protein